MNTLLIALALCMTGSPQATEGLNAYRVSFNRIGGVSGVQRVVVWARTQNDARRQAEVLYHARPTAIVLIREKNK